MPSTMQPRTYNTKEGKSKSRYKAAKNELICLLGLDAEDGFKLKPLLVYYSQSPRTKEIFQGEFSPQDPVQRHGSTEIFLRIGSIIFLCQVLELFAREISLHLKHC